MKLGLLQCDDVTASLQARHGNYPEMFLRLLREHIPAAEVQVFRTQDGDLPARIDDCDAYLTTGSKYGVYDGLPWIAELQAFVVELWERHKPLVGICFGHQLMAQALGGEVRKSEKGWGVGVSFNRVMDRKPWMEPWQDKLDLIVSHQDQVMLLPPQAEVLAQSEFCNYYLVQYGEHFMSVQGHPEFCKGYSRDLMTAREGMIPAERLRAGHASLNAEIDGPLMMRWIVSFLQRGAARHHALRAGSAAGERDIAGY
ncbi:gamma-glutamyl-gamma-aminobutyrate hydrolase family protein [Halopseudomonas nanhaiensis]|uniref:glutamine amidotransferase-related protein n=1 Tax=Halopseudomonas nanhaiensis TaxID=2830842 RepID=UPI001CBF4D04|nr:gamma-glutamyl-gamma-aminobutyrate hydrolase family protein [Halopseudomonas nanhaiensis]UAW99838.1 gamma-glutamyl-gamma-aminobutyrate hydrolase family protein [Halopseudomonas nanhaiensis]